MPTITGYVYDDTGAPAEARQVRLHRRDSGVVVGTGVTGPVSATAGDDYYASVGVLLPLNGTNGGTSFPDAIGNVWTPAGGAATSTAHSFFGTGVGIFDGDARITTPNSSTFDITTGDFTIELLVRFTATGVAHILINKGTNTGVFAYQIWVDSSNRFGFRKYANTGSGFDVNILGGTMASGVDYFISARRSGDVFTLHVNNALIGSATAPGALFLDASGISIGAYQNGIGGMTGYLGQLRITKGIVRPTTAPTAAWPTNISVSELLAGEYSIDTSYVGEVQRIVLDDSAGTLYNDLIDRVILS